jgi:hypothetical protein
LNTRQYLSQVSWAATPSPALVGNPKTETGIGASNIAAHGARTAKSDIRQCKYKCPLWVAGSTDRRNRIPGPVNGRTMAEYSYIALAFWLKKHKHPA